LAVAEAMARTALSIFVDDTHFDPPGAFAEFVDFCLAERVRGKVSLIAGLAAAATGGPPLGLAEGDKEQAYLAQVRRIAAAGFGVHMELMTHDKLWDFAQGRMRRDGPCEGIWLYDPKVSVAEYEVYLEGVLELASRAGVTLTGLSVPGCDCDECQTAWARLQSKGHDNLSDNAWTALLNLARRGRFAGPAVPVYSDEADEAHPTRMMRAEGGFGVCDVRLDMSVQDQIGFSGSDADFYISADGTSGRIVDLVLGGAVQCFFCAHWFAMNPRNPEGWATFQEIIRRINAKLSDRIEWVKPADYALRLLRAG
jgi:hypothetical protein